MAHQGTQKYLRIVGEDWDAIREQFSEVEKESLRKAVRSMAVCPRLVTIAEPDVAPELLSKLKTALESLKGRSKCLESGGGKRTSV